MYDILADGTLKHIWLKENIYVFISNLNFGSWGFNIELAIHMYQYTTIHWRIDLSPGPEKI